MKPEIKRRWVRAFDWVLAAAVLVAVYAMCAHAIFMQLQPEGDAITEGRAFRIAESLRVKAELPPIAWCAYTAWPYVRRNALFCVEQGTASIRFDRRLLSECSDCALEGLIGHELGHYKMSLLMRDQNIVAIDSMIRCADGDSNIERVANAFAGQLVGYKALFEAKVAVDNE